MVLPDLAPVPLGPRDVEYKHVIIPHPEIHDGWAMPERDFEQPVVLRTPRSSSAAYSRGVVAEPGQEIAGPSQIKEYSVGQTDVECWGRLWMASASDPEVDGEEWVTFLQDIEENFRTNYENFHDEFYFWGDFSGDRTLDLKIAEPTVLTARLLADLQKYLQMNGQKMWRIRIPVYFKPNDPHRVVVVYPHAMDIPPIYGVVAGENA